MTDVFISYAHEDQAFVRRMVSALEAEGFSVWWDHTIPPGKSWDTFIAKGIAEARCCIVVWSPRSVESDWVKEEATLAKDANKLLPVTIDAAEPPVGFRRMQAANLDGWNGNANHAQWQLLVREARELVGRPATLPRPRPAPRAAPSKRPPFALIVGGIAVLAAAASIAFVVLQRPSSEAEAPDAPAAEVITEAPSSTEAGVSPIEQAPPRREPVAEQPRAREAAERPAQASAWTYERVMAERGAWASRVGRPTNEPEEFRGYFIVAQNVCCAKQGSIVSGSFWDGSTNPVYDVIYGRGHSGCTRQVLLTEYLTFLGMEWDPAFEQVSARFAADFAARYPNASSSGDIPCRNSRAVDQ